VIDIKNYKNQIEKILRILSAKSKLTKRININFTRSIHMLRMANTVGVGNGQQWKWATVRAIRSFWPKARMLPIANTYFVKLQLTLRQIIKF
jgi:hypothetical protein